MVRIPELKRDCPDNSDMPAPQKPAYPYYPVEVPEGAKIRQRLLDDLNHWDNNDPDIARATAKTFIELLKRQFDLPGE